MVKNHVSLLLQFIVSTYFSNLTSVLIVYNSTDVSNMQVEYLHGLQDAFRNQSQQTNIIGMQWIDVGRLSNVTAFEAKMLHANEIPIEGFITILTNTTLFLHARYYATRHSSLRLKDKIYLFLSMGENPHDFLASKLLQFYPHHLMITMTTLTNHKYENRKTPYINVFQDQRTIQNAVNYMNNSIEIAFELWTQRFIGTVDSNLDAILLDTFYVNGSFARDVELYPDKLSNLNGRPLLVSSVTYVPYTISNAIAPGSPNTDPVFGTEAVFFSGIESILLKTFCYVHNCHLRIEIHDGDNWGEIYENGSSYGVIGDIYEKRVEIGMGCFFNWFPNLTDPSNSIARSSVALIGPTPRKFPAWRTNILPFTGKLWLLLLTTLALCVLTLFLINIERKQKGPYINVLEISALDVVAVFLQQPYSNRLDDFAARFFLATLLIAALTIENTYSGQLKSMLTLPFFEEPVDTVEKWAHADWKWGAPSVVWVKTIQNSEVSKEQAITKNFEIGDDTFLYKKGTIPNYGIAVERLNSGSFSFGDYIKPETLESKIILKDDVFFDYTRAIAIRGWPMMEIFNEHILLTLETGLYIRWEREMVAKYLDSYTQQILFALTQGHSPKVPPQEISIENISGAFLALAIGCLISGIVLILEIVIDFMHSKKGIKLPEAL